MDITSLLELKIDLLTKGVCLNGKFDLDSRAFLSSISDGVHIVIYKDIYVTASINKKSPFILSKDTDDNFILKKNSLEIKVDVISSGKYFGVKSSDGTLMEDIGTFQTDRLRISAFKGCNFVVNNEGCKFCEASYKRNIRRNKIENIMELIEYVEIYERRIKHYLVSGGTPPDNEWDHFINVCQTIRNKSQKPIYAMFSPPSDLSIIKNIIDVGVQDIAINIELYDRLGAQKVIPGKTRLGIEIYFDCLKYAVKLLGNKGNVKSALIVGLEDYSYTLEGVENLAKIGVMPILSIFKPVNGTPLEAIPSPEKTDLLKVWEEAQRICENYSLTLGPLCKQCQNNTLAIPINEKYFLYE